MTAPATFPDTAARPPAFADADICREAGFTLCGDAARPIFDDDVWDFTGVAGLPVQMRRSARRLDFTVIAGPGWRTLAKELIFALLCPRHPSVAPLPRAYRMPLHLSTAKGRLDELATWFGWLAGKGIASLAEVDDDRCREYLAHRRYVLDGNGIVVGERSPAIRRRAAQVAVDLVSYRELFSADRVSPGLRPWSGASATAVAEMPSGRTGNKTPPVHDSLLRPLLAAALHLVSAIGPHVSGLLQEVAEAGRRWSSSAPGLSHAGRVPEKEFPALLDDYERNGRALPLLPAHHLQDRLKSGWPPDDPLAPLALSLLARQAGFTQFPLRWIPALRDGIEATLSVVGADKPFARGAAPVARADADATIPWTLPLDRLEATGLAGIVRTAAIITLAAVSGMRSSELMELRVGCCRPPESHGPGLVRYRLAGTIIKGQPLGGLADEWVVIEPAYQAARLLEQLHGNPEDGVPLLGRFAFDVRYAWFRNWVNSPAGQRHGLAPIPDGPVTLRALRRTLSLELAYRPGGLLAAKLHLKHIAVATTEGYASRPGGAQAELLAEVNKHEAERNLELVWAEFRNYQQGIMPAGPGARELAEFFAHIDGKLAAGDPGAPKTQASDRDVLNLMTKRAQTLHLGTSNYCWFTDPSRALCLKLAGDPAADKPLIGMCDPARCPQATHHPCHRPVWAEHAENTKTFLGQLGPTRKTERKRLQAEYDRAARVLARIDEAAGEAE